MAEQILSVGIDVGTSTTEVVFSRLTIENTASAFSVPRISIVAKEVIYRSQIYLTPLVRPDLMDVDALRAIVEAEYQAAQVQPGEVNTGAAIITGETARADNAEQVLHALSELAGDFVVATAGPALESVLAARGVGIDSWSKEHRGIVANLDIGGGTTNIAAYKSGRLLGASCLDIGGRLVRVIDGKISYLSHQIKRLAEASDIPLAVGDTADPARLQTLTRVMARQLAMGLGLVHPDATHASMYTNAGRALNSEIAPGTISFSGGVADLIDADRALNPFRYGDIGPLLGAAIADDSAFRLVERFHGAETIGATVVGAGVHTTEISGSTIEYARDLLPMQNVPILRISDEDAADPIRLAATIKAELAMLNPDDPSQSVAVAFSGYDIDSFTAVQETADAIISGADVVLSGPYPLVIVLENDRAMVLGQALKVKRGRSDDVVCIDSIFTGLGDYIDIGVPVGAGQAVPVVVKTLVFND
ncbi:ethanolamine ammonia-lyase reactivating factor EutA [Propionimicrobium sp. PCR01-08-3]|uniref:ethanolamine ammonia-lyase reactivating factor EutA n=1 Tax=Propionimicrobium sp. PCR01-08-3 TaxID=3052086 RepID=UPI00255C5B39|nr:ethanolamine ammonia-lyase reactivating factor EutA [Propionimicrobium sp. PCR01-08-3]WIY82123.1 ethanolamine ammonia-lyase reactivating factor EutA [Propionimicrobium sp. PCR01-08-3]